MTKLYTRTCAACGRRFDTFNRFDRLCLEHKHFEYDDPDLMSGKPYKVYKCAKCGRTCSASRIKDSGGIEGYCVSCQEWGPIDHSLKSAVVHHEPTEINDVYVAGPNYNYPFARAVRAKRLSISEEDKEIIKQQGKDLTKWIIEALRKQKETGKVPCILCKKEHAESEGTELFCPDCAKIHVPTISPQSKNYLPGKSSSGKIVAEFTIEKQESKQLCPVCSKNLIDEDVKVCEPCRLELIKAPKKGNQKQKPKPGQRKVQYNGRSSDSDK